MSEPTIVCPKCNTRIPLTKALTTEIEQSLKRDFDKEMQVKKRQIETEYADRLAREVEKGAQAAQVRAQKENAHKLTALQKEIEAARKREQCIQADFQRQMDAQVAKAVKEAQASQVRVQKEDAQKLRALQKQIEETGKREQSLQADFQRRIDAEVAKAAREAQQKAGVALRHQVENLRAEISEKDKQVQEARRTEERVRRLQQELERKEEQLQQKLRTQVAIARRDIETKVSKEYEHKALEKNKQLMDMQKQIQELKRKAEQGSQQTQGEAFELALENRLLRNFPRDDIRGVPAGVRGADIIQLVRDSGGDNCGSILWETKNARVWNKSWIVKLKSDQRKTKADFAVLLTSTFPRGEAQLTQCEGIWIVDFGSSIGLATALRSHIVEVERYKQAGVGTDEKVRRLYGYLSGTEFRQHIEAIVESFRGMQCALEKEKRDTEKRWAERQQQIHSIVTNVVGIYGGLQTSSESALPKIKHLELPTPD